MSVPVQADFLFRVNGRAMTWSKSLILETVILLGKKALMSVLTYIYMSIFGTITQEW